MKDYSYNINYFCCPLLDDNTTTNTSSHKNSKEKFALQKKKSGVFV